MVNKYLLGLCTLGLFLMGGSGCKSQEIQSFIVMNATIVDGTGAPARVGAVRVAEGRIVGIGDVEVQSGDNVIDGAGLVLAPGFIDTHSHHDRGLLDDRAAADAVSQGITTVVVGQDGGSPFPLSDFFGRIESTPTAINVASYAGHNSIRRHVMGDDYERPATEGEIAEMQSLLLTEMETGALGLSTGLEYDPGIYSTTDEVLALARTAAGEGGRYISHLRSEDRRLGEAVDEIIAIGRETGMPVQISHFKIAIVSRWGEAEEFIARLDRAREEGVNITADVYPYEYWQSTLTVLFPERDFDNRETAAFVLEQLAPPEGLLMSRFGPDSTYVGKTIAEIAVLRNTDPVTTLIDMLAEAESANPGGRWEGDVGVIGTSMKTEDVIRLMQWEHTNIGSDGALNGRHPRGIGTYPRVLGRYARDRGAFSLEEAVFKMTGLAADHMGFSDRGTISVGSVADLVLFDPEIVIDRATPAEPHLQSEGVVMVWVNGVTVFRDGEATGAFPGTVLKRGEGGPR